MVIRLKIDKENVHRQKVKKMSEAVAVVVVAAVASGMTTMVMKSQKGRTYRIWDRSRSR